MSEKRHFIGLKKFRERMGWQQNQLAEKLGLSPSNYHHWESGKYEASFLAIQKLFELGATVEELFGVDYSSKPPKADLKVSKEEAIEIVRVGMSGLIGSVGIIQNNDILKEDLNAKDAETSSE